jgi:hypothetical protein
MQLLLMIKQTVESTDRAQVLNLGDERSLVELGTFKDTIHAHAKDSALSFAIDWKIPRKLGIIDPTRRGKELFGGNSFRFESKVHQGASRKLDVDEFSYTFCGHRFVLRSVENSSSRFGLSASGPSGFQFIRTPGRAWPLPRPIKCYGFPDQTKAYFKNADFLSDLALEFEKLFNNLYYLGPLREYPKREYTWDGARPADMGRRGERVVHALLASRESGERISRGKGVKGLTVEEFAAKWLRDLGLIHEFRLSPVAESGKLYQLRIQKTRGSSEVLITDVGFGVSQILPVIVLCYYAPRGSTIVLEQPEIHLHPSVQAGLADVFIDAARNNGVQILVESHSEHLLKRLQRRIAEEQLASSDAALYFCEYADHQSRISPLQLDSFGNILNWPKEFFGDQFGEVAAMTKAVMERKARQ